MPADHRVLPPLALRPGRDGDAAGFIRLIGRCWADYPGCVLDVDAEAPELRALATHYAAAGGGLWVAADGMGDVAGMAAVRPSASEVGNGVWEVCRVYVHPDWHGAGVAGRLMDRAEGFAAGRGARALELWTDTRFRRAHRFYEKRGYARGGWRALFDLARSEEWRYARAAPGSEKLGSERLGSERLGGQGRTAGVSTGRPAARSFK